MNLSIKRFLLFYLLLTITLISALMITGNYYLNNHALKRSFDDQLKQTVVFLKALVESAPNEAYLERLEYHIDALTLKKAHDSISNISSNAYQIEFLVIDAQGKILLDTHDIPPEATKIEKEGFSNVFSGHHQWRLLKESTQTQPVYTIIVASQSDLHGVLLRELSWNNLIMILWGYPLLGLFIWLSIDRGLSSLRRLTDDITNRQSTRLDTVDVRNAPLEVKPLVEALNHLFGRLQETFERNKLFPADAAHELRTPLAALKTQAQVALKVLTEEERKTGLRNVIEGVDRCTHIVQQLLTLSRLEPEAGLQERQYFNLSKLAAEIIAQLVPKAISKNIEVELISEHDDISLYGNETFIAILIRNLMDNAIRYTPENGDIRVSLQQPGNQTIITVTDSGPGIPPNLRSRVFERFFRVLGTKSSGSGLGLAIVA